MMWLRGVQQGLLDAGKELPSPALWAQIVETTAAVTETPLRK